MGWVGGVDAAGVGSACLIAWVALLLRVHAAEGKRAAPGASHTGQVGNYQRWRMRMRRARASIGKRPELVFDCLLDGIPITVVQGALCCSLVSFIVSRTNRMNDFFARQQICSRNSAFSCATAFFLHNFFYKLWASVLMDHSRYSGLIHHTFVCRV